MRLLAFPGTYDARRYQRGVLPLTAILRGCLNKLVRAVEATGSPGCVAEVNVGVGAIQELVRMLFASY
jgi:hypothetical protein